jgi:GDP-L-fucose synthase
MILITGGGGFVGRHLQEELRARQVPYDAFASREHDLTDPRQADAAFERAGGDRISTILHLACYQAAGEFPARNPGAQFIVNNRIHLNVLDSWRRLAPRARLIAIGSSCAYPSDLLALTEDKLMDGPIHGSVYSYAFTKRALHTGILAHNDQYQLNGSYVIPPTLFGEHDDFNVETAHVSGALVGKFVKAARLGGTVEVWGDGSQVREFLDVKVFVRTLLDLAPRLDREVLNVAPGVGTSIKTLAETIADAAGVPDRIHYDTTKYTGIREKFLNVERLQSRYGVHLPADIGDGLRRTVRWYEANFEALKDRRKFDAQGRPVHAGA